MRHIAKTINLASFKSYMKSLIPAAKNREPIDIREKKNQERLNSVSNYSMCPYLTKVVIKYNKKEKPVIKYWAWQTLHKIYLFFRDNVDLCIENLNADDIETWFGVDIEFFMENYETLKRFVTDYITTGEESIDTDPDLINFHIVDDLETNECVDFIDYFPCYRKNRKDPDGVYSDRISDNKPYRDDIEHVDDLQCYANIALPIYVSNKIDNVGLMETIPDEWQEQTSYTIGNLVFYDTDDWYLKEGKGYTWDSTFKESLFGNLRYEGNDLVESEKPQWIRNIGHEMTERVIDLDESKRFLLDGKDFSSFMGEVYYTGGSVNYAYKGMNFIANPYHKNMGDPYEMIKVDGKTYIIYDNVLTEIKDYDIVKHFNCESGYYEVYHECNNQYHYLLYNEEKIYGYEEDGSYHFQYYGIEYSSEKIKGLHINNAFVELNDKNYKEDIGFIIENSNLIYKTLPDTSCVMVNGKWYIEDRSKLYEYKKVGSEDSIVVTFQKNDNETTDFGLWLDPKAPHETKKDILGKMPCYCIDSDILYVVEPYTEYSLNYVSGTTESQLGMFRVGDFIYDELGNSINGAVLPSKNDDGSYGVLRPQPYKSLSLNYIKNSTRNVKVVDVENNRVIGDILRKIEFFVTLNNEEVYVDEKLKNILDFDDLTTGEQLDVIFSKLNIVYNEEKDKFELVVETQGVNDFSKPLETYGISLKCRFTYNLGAFLEFNREKGEYNLAANSHEGVEYTEVYTVIRSSKPYYRSINDVYTIYSYELEPDNTRISDDESKRLVALTDFTMEIPIYRAEGNKSEIDDKKNHYGDGFDKLDKYKNFVSMPLIHRNFNNGMVSQEKVDGNIYIDRGISSSFEKHFKLQEVATMDDLETYSNGGFFNITNDNA